MARVGGVGLTMTLCPRMASGKPADCHALSAAVPAVGMRTSQAAKKKRYRQGPVHLRGWRVQQHRYHFIFVLPEDCFGLFEA